MSTSLHIDSDTYVGASGYVFTRDKRYVHREIAARALGRPLKPSEVVHHLDGDRSNNSLSNLLICKQDLHMDIHARQRCYEAGFDPHTHKWCSITKSYLPRTEFSKLKSSFDGLNSASRDAENARRRAKKGVYYKWDVLKNMQQQYRRALKKGKCSAL